jgi:transposase
VLKEIEDSEQIIERIAALDIGKAELTCCVRLPSQARPGKRRQEVSRWPTMTRQLLRLADHLQGLGVTRVVMEATSDYWKPPYYVLEAAGLETWLVNPRDVKHLPGRPKTDTIDAVWLCKVAERQMLRPSFVPPAEIRRLRDLTRYRVDLVAARTAEKNRAEKFLEDAGIKLSVVASDLFGMSGRDMMRALIAGERDPQVLANLARSRLRGKIPRLVEAFTGYFTGHHAFLLDKMLTRVEAIEADIAELDSKIEAELGDLAPFTHAVDRLVDIPGIGQVAAHALLAEIGLDMTRFPTAGHLCSWLKFTPIIKASAGKTKGKNTTGHGNRYAGRILGEAALAAGRTSTFLGERYRRIARRRGKKTALVAIGRSILIIIWHLLSNPEARYHDLGADYYHTRIHPDRTKRHHIHQLQALGYTVTLQPTA